ncbi:MAG: RNA polymerase sigma factor [Polyangiaceae bacterium]|nr:RNA polymerase sigma factor [Polyangiaceae bacterium]
MTKPEGPSPNLSNVRTPWHRFLEEVEPLRPELYRYCRHLTRSPWDAEDLVQDTLARAFVMLGCVAGDIANPRAWMFRVASNLWLNQVRRARELATDDLRAREAPEATVDPRTTREAAGTLVSLLSPQERAAVVLKDVFAFSLEEVAETLSTSVGAIKAALHRGRGKLSEPSEETSAIVKPAVLDAFTDAFNARDLDRLTALLVESVTMEFPGLHVEHTVEGARKGPLAGVLYGNPASDHSPIAPQFRNGVLPQAPRLEIRIHRGEALLLGWFAHEDGDAVRAISRVDVEDDRICRVRTYMHQPEVLAEICKELDVPFRSSGHRHWW